jgi:predicted  nucleic acid-binding Zn-ribbon protein
LKEITAIQSLISERQSSLSQIESRKEEISREIKSLEKKDIFRSEKIALMDLEMEMQKLNQERNNYEAEVTAREKEIADKMKKIEELKKTPFFKRLLRQ